MPNEAMSISKKELERIDELERLIESSEQYALICELDSLQTEESFVAMARELLAARKLIDDVHAFRSLLPGKICNDLAAYRTGYSPKGSG